MTHRALVVAVLDLPAAPEVTRDDELSHWSGVAARAVDQGADALMVSVVGTGTPDVGPTGPDPERVPRLVAALRTRHEVPVGVQTPDPVVLRAALGSGAVFASDQDGFRDRDRLAVCAAAGATVVLTGVHPPGGVPADGPDDHELLAMRALLGRCADAALAAGVPRQRIVVDDGLDLPGIGSLAHALLASSEQLVALGHPGALAPPSASLDGVQTAGPARRAAEQAALVLGLVRGCRMLRVRDVRTARRTADIVAELLRRRDGRAGPGRVGAAA